MFLIVIV